MKKEVHTFEVGLTRPQFRQLMTGGAIRLKPGQYGGPHKLHLSKSTYNKLKKAADKQVGCQVRMSPDEFRRTVEGEGFKDWWKQKALPWLKRAGNDVAKEAWKVTKRVGRKLYGNVKQVGQAAEDAVYRNADAATNMAKSQIASVNLLAGGRVPKGLHPERLSHTNPADNLENRVDVGLFGIHNQTPDHVLMYNNSNFVPAAHPASNPTLIQWDPLARMSQGKVVSGPQVGKARVAYKETHPALTPVFREEDNIRNTPAALSGGSFLAAGAGFKPPGY